MELVDRLELDSSAVRRKGSSPLSPTTTDGVATGGCK